MKNKGMAMSFSEKIATALCAIVALLFVFSLLPFSSTGQTELVVQPKVEWTFMVYMDGDNNLEGAAVEDFNEMEKAFLSSTYQVNVVVQFDRIDGYDTSNGDWKDCKRFAVEADRDTSEITTDPVKELGEVNMGDPDTLVDFVKWCFEYYPAKKYALVLWDHGGAYRGVCWDDTNLTEQGRADCITVPELKQALKEIKQANDYRNLDLVGFDACLMSQVAIMYEIMDYADVGIASGFVEPGDGWPYEAFLPTLLGQPQMGKEKLAEVIAEAYQSSYSDRADDPSDSFRTSMTAINLTLFSQFTQVLNKFSVELSKVAGDNYKDIMFARNRALSYDMVPIGPFTFTKYCLTDVTDFCVKIIEDPIFKIYNMDLTRAAQDVIDAQVTTTIANYAYPALDTTLTAKNAHGLTIYFPNNIDTTWDERYSELQFPHDMFWDDFLKEYWFKKVNAGNTPPSCFITYPRDINKTANQDDLFIPITGTAFDDEKVQMVEIAIDNDTWYEVEMKTGDSVDWYYDLPVMDLEPGEHTIKARAFDEMDSKSPVFTTTIYIEKGAEKTVSDEGFTFDFNYMAGAVIIGAIVLGVAILVRDKRKNYN